MASALECWSRRGNNNNHNNNDEEDMVEQVLMETNPSSQPNNKDSSIIHKKFNKLTRNVSEAIASLKNTLNINLNLDSSKPDNNNTCRSSNNNLVWGTVVRNLTQLYPGSQLPEKLMSNIRKHYDSLPPRYESHYQF
ncbi:mitogen-activated protein kinase kinase kinase 10-like protein [Trifolium pratense]|uniref:Mitogen-activated protein kinase kinase kinase 10-like protein n=1 Tax=Trifolium pratense TaxID=57577 RepID=A0A2K3KZJ0_TRIPR|nr:mitogen-activated protein kinase kinase kinase 10-like protein [Trifolium pratense]